MKKRNLIACLLATTLILSLCPETYNAQVTRKSLLMIDKVRRMLPVFNSMPGVTVSLIPYTDTATYVNFNVKPTVAQGESFVEVLGNSSTTRLFTYYGVPTTAQEGKIILNHGI